MPKPQGRTTFFCQQCGNESAKWLGRCPNCGEWNSYTQAPALSAAGRRGWLSRTSDGPQELAQVEQDPADHLPLPFREFNQIMGGGLVKGSVLLLAGEPGIGKSTLLLQTAGASAGSIGPVLYISGEESGSQVQLRAQRLGISGKGLYFLAETQVEKILEDLDRLRPALVVVDSIQTLFCQEVPSDPGTIAQVREATRLLLQWAKASAVPVLMAGHVTKDGAVAGPRVLEHMVDVVLYLEGELTGPLRLLRVTKNRFGATNDVALFQMGPKGLEEVEEPSRALLSLRHRDTSGSAVVILMEGSRPLLVEVQALTSPSFITPPRRVGNGIDLGRLLLLSAVLTKRARLPLANQDIIVNVTSGLRISEPAADLGIALAIASSLWDASLDASTVFLGEVGLSGELRPVPQPERRLTEAAKLGFQQAILPASPTECPPVRGMQQTQVATLREALRLALPRGARNTPELP